MDDDWWLDRLSQGFISYPQYSGKVLVEYVSANPTGPIHIGHGRGAVVGSVLANLPKEVLKHAMVSRFTWYLVFAISLDL